jgi:hypothetical protein
MSTISKMKNLLGNNKATEVKNNGNKPTPTKLTLTHMALKHGLTRVVKRLINEGVANKEFEPNCNNYAFLKVAVAAKQKLSRVAYK